MPEPEIDEHALCTTRDVAPGTRIAAFARVLDGARIGADCRIGEKAFVGSGALIGERVSVGVGAHLADGVSIGDDVSIGANATFSEQPPAWGPDAQDAQGSRGEKTLVGAGASIGANATISRGLEIGRGAQIGAGAVVTRSVPPNAIVIGNPAHIVGYTDSPQADLAPGRQTASSPETVSLAVDGVRLTRSAEFSDLRGSLTAGDLPQDGIPFAPRRWFLVYDVPNQEVRGEHAHRVCHQFLLCVAGSMAVAVDDGERRAEVSLDSPLLGLYIPPLVWATQFHYSSDAVLLVLASHPYDAEDYIRDYEAFLAAAAA
jgi:UDP-2-acetamido-3-amino-2,3-dideoxy-glucuronate N-acetyltransferase